MCQCPMPQEEKMTNSPRPASSASCLAMTSAMGERQILPVHTKTISSGRPGSGPLIDNPLKLIGIGHGVAGVRPFLRCAITPGYRDAIDTELGCALDVVGTVTDHEDALQPRITGGEINVVDDMSDHRGLGTAGTVLLRCTHELEEVEHLEFPQGAFREPLTLGGGGAQAVTLLLQPDQQLTHTGELRGHVPSNLTVVGEIDLQALLRHLRGHPQILQGLFHRWARHPVDPFLRWDLPTHDIQGVQE